MKLPRDVSGERLLRRLGELGYVVVRQKGSHVRLSHPGPPQAHIAIPMHRQLRVGTLHDILNAVAEQRGVSLEDVARDL